MERRFYKNLWNNKIWYIILIMLSFIYLILVFLPHYYWYKELKRFGNPKLMGVNMQEKDKNNLCSSKEMRISYEAGNNEMTVQSKTELKNCKLCFYSKGNPIGEIKFNDIVLNKGDKFIVKNYLNIIMNDFEFTDLTTLESELSYDLKTYPIFLENYSIFAFNTKYLIKTFQWFHKNFWNQDYINTFKKQEKQERKIIDEILQNVLIDYENNYLKLGLKKEYFTNSKIFSNNFNFNIGNIKFKFAGLYQNYVLLNGFSLNSDLDSDKLSNEKDQEIYFLNIKNSLEDLKHLVEVLNTNASTEIILNSIEICRSEKKLISDCDNENSETFYRI